MASHMNGLEPKYGSVKRPLGNPFLTTAAPGMSDFASVNIVKAPTITVALSVFSDTNNMHGKASEAPSVEVH